MYTLLKHIGDWSAAAKALSGKYGKRLDDRASEPEAEGVTEYVANFGKPSDAATEPKADEDCDYDFATNEDLERLDTGVSWVWDKWLQCGVVNLLASEGGIGKTRFVADLCRRVHAGQSWPDGTAMTPWDGKYLAMWVAGDRNHKELLTLTKAFGFGDRVCYSGSKKDPYGRVRLDTPSEFKALSRKFRAAKPLFLVIDTTGGTTYLDMTKQEDAKAFFTPLSDLAVRCKVCVIVITHVSANKTVLGKRAEERVRCVIRMTAADRRPETVRRIEVWKSNSLYPDPLGMIHTGDGYMFDLTPPPSPEDQGGWQAGGTSRGMDFSSITCGGKPLGGRLGLPEPAAMPPALKESAVAILRAIEELGGSATVKQIAELTKQSEETVERKAKTMGIIQQLTTIEVAKGKSRQFMV